MGASSMGVSYLGITNYRYSPAGLQLKHWAWRMSQVGRPSLREGRSSQMRLVRARRLVGQFPQTVLVISGVLLAFLNNWMFRARARPHGGTHGATYWVDRARFLRVRA